MRTAESEEEFKALRAVATDLKEGLKNVKKAGQMLIDLP